jgi:hypothetical protein
MAATTTASQGVLAWSTWPLGVSILQGPFLSGRLTFTSSSPIPTLKCEYKDKFDIVKDNFA